MEQKILYFGYGANSQREMMEAITGNRNLVGQPGVLKGFKLCVQRMDQVPDSVSPNSPVPVSPKQIIKDNWPDSFETYIIKPGDDADRVVGTVWELTPLERELVRDWELVDFGWYKDIKGKAVTQDVKEINIETEGLREDQQIDREVDGKDYKPFLNPLADFQRVAEKSRKEYFERISTQEGVSPKRLI
ncbi:MAG: hypothetical protein HY424_01465 [Candidatus Levybacteria bacterium]|nr:hypothetical protein [Candidatus Levybacteria bacterium]